MAAVAVVAIAGFIAVRLRRQRRELREAEVPVSDRAPRA
jgi:hypothetical protein